MLTRLEVRGFKNLLDTSADFGPFTCIAGANGIGKSNVFDAIEFLSHLASDPLVESAQRVRGSDGSRGGDVRDLFSDGYRAAHHRIDLAAEMIVPVEVEDDLGASAEATTTFLRYELSLGYEAPAGLTAGGRPILLREELTHIGRGEAARRLRFPHDAGTFRNAVLVGQARGGAYLSWEGHDGAAVFTVRGDGGSRGRSQFHAAAQAACRWHDGVVAPARRTCHPVGGGNPNGKQPLALPKHHQIERIADPKSALQGLLLAAADVTGRRRDRVARRLDEHRRQLLGTLDPAGAVTRLSSRQQPVSSIDAAAVAMS